MKKIFSLLLAVAMIFAIAVSALPVSAESGSLLENSTLADLALSGDAAATSYADRANDAGWSATNARSDIPTFTSASAVVTLNGKTSAPGTLTSPVIAGGIDKLAFNYGFAFGDNQFKLNITVKSADGTTVLKTASVEKTGLSKEVEYSETLDIGVAEDCILVIENACLSAVNSNKDRVAIWNLQWTTPASSEVTTEEVPVTTEEAPVTTEEVPGTTEEVPGTTEEVPGTTEPSQSGDTGDNGVFFAVAAVAVVVIAGTALIARKRED
ncbi:MAG: hypothetical protein ACI3XI_01405 [Eubacteriales bacterium]